MVFKKFENQGKFVKTQLHIFQFSDFSVQIFSNLSLSGHEKCWTESWQSVLCVFTNFSWFSEYFWNHAVMDLWSTITACFFHAVMVLHKSITAWFSKKIKNSWKRNNTFFNFKFWKSRLEKPKSTCPWLVFWLKFVISKNQTVMTSL